MIKQAIRIALKIFHKDLLEPILDKINHKTKPRIVE